MSLENPIINEQIENKGNLPKKKKFIKSAILSLVSLFLFVFLVYQFFLSTPLNFPDGIIVNIGQGSSLRNISLDLKNKHVIRSRLAFETFVILDGGEKHIANGDYLFEQGVPVFEVARRIAVKDRHLAPIKITIPEGFDNIQIADAFVQKLPTFNKENFLNLAQGKEGYLFPDTYFFFSNAKEQDVLKSLMDDFNKKIKPIISDINASGKTEQEIIVMASLIEREAKGDADRGYVSGILWNRINKGMPLQVDADPSTYKTKGLPESPICNPGLLAIEAALHPVASNYLYYLHDKNGQIHYAKTFTEHKHNKKLYLK